ncbi:uncharacterized protein [Eurosta solidaginis]|uniref:uncharacterized protein isoform X2 n=1 Tax=Eurosta solidaginis TaxID=178769 RepID=UPI003530B93F
MAKGKEPEKRERVIHKKKTLSKMKSSKHSASEDDLKKMRSLKRKQTEIARVLQLKCEILLRGNLSYLEYTELREEICRLNVLKESFARQAESYESNSVAAVNACLTQVEADINAVCEFYNARPRGSQDTINGNEIAVINTDVSNEGSNAAANTDVNNEESNAAANMDACAASNHVASETAASRHRAPRKVTAVPRLRNIVVKKLDLELTADDILNYIRSKLGVSLHWKLLRILKFPLKSKAKSSTFLIRLPENFFYTVRDSTFWPKRCVVGNFYNDKHGRNSKKVKV